MGSEPSPELQHGNFDWRPVVSILATPFDNALRKGNIMTDTFFHTPTKLPTVERNEGLTTLPAGTIAMKWERLRVVDILDAIGMSDPWAGSIMAILNAQPLWVGMVTDLDSRCVLAASLTINPPLPETAINALDLAMRDKTSIAQQLGCFSDWSLGGIPVAVAIDASCSVSRSILKTCEQMGISVVCLADHSAVFEDLGLHIFARKRGSRQTINAHKPDVQPGCRSSANEVVQSLEDELRRVIVDNYHNRPNVHVGGFTPFHAWSQMTLVSPRRKYAA